MVEVKVFRIKQRQAGGKQVTLFLGVMSAGDLIRMTEVDSFRPSNPKGYQRSVTQARRRDMAYYIAHEEGVLPTSILLGIRDNGESYTFAPEYSVGKSAEFGTLRIKDGVPLWIIDGQHRIEGTREALDEGLVPGLADYGLPVSIMAGLDRGEEMRHFYLINTRMRGIPTDMVDILLNQMREEHGDEDMKKLTGRLSSVQARDQRRSRASKVTQELVKEESPWKGAILLPTEEAPRGMHSVRLHTFVASLDPVMKDSYVTDLSDEQLVKFLALYWRAVQQAWPEAAEDPGEYNLFRTSGMYALHAILPDVMKVCLEAREWSQDKIAEILKSTGAKSSFWNKESLPMQGTDMRSLRRLSESLRQSLPKVTIPGL